jgi:hypothetical protein
MSNKSKAEEAFDRMMCGAGDESDIASLDGMYATDIPDNTISDMGREERIAWCKFWCLSNKMEFVKLTEDGNKFHVIDPDVISPGYQFSEYNYYSEIGKHMVEEFMQSADRALRHKEDPKQVVVMDELTRQASEEMKNIDVSEDLAMLSKYMNAPAETSEDLWIPVDNEMPPRHLTVLAKCTNGDIYQCRVCYGMHEPWWCGHNELNFGIVLSDKGLIVESWKRKN